MGFYGNITNTARTQFQFDKVYPNRYEMEQKTKTDGIYAGRYILIEYDSDVKFDHMIRVWINGNKFYTQSNFDNATLLRKGDIELKEIIYTAVAATGRPDPRDYKDCVFYKCVGFDSDDIAMFEEVADGSESPAYTVNYNIDTDVFGAGRGYDSTVWQKTYSAESGEKYVMIAELNTVVPTFDVTPDAPTMNPVVPHFDTQSTDVYYKLHWQAPWGFRVKATDASKSDETTTHTITTYDPETGKNTTSATNNIPAAIYYNDAGFAAQVDVNRESTEGINKHSATVTEDEIKIEPTGKSGNKYNDHEGQSTQSEQFDIQEMTINLPSIGNMMSDAWDIIHGPRRNDDMRETDPETGDYVASLKGRLLSIDVMDDNQIPIKRIDNGRLVGTKINGDIRDTTATNSDAILSAELSSSYESDDAWIETKVDADNSPNAIAIHHTFHAAKNSLSDVNLNDHSYDQQTTYFKEKQLATYNHKNDDNDIVNLYVPYVDAAGHVVGHNIETVTLPYGFKTITIGDESSETIGVVAAAGNVVADNTQDTLTIKPGNKWIHISASDVQNNDIIVLSHEVNAIDTTAAEDLDLNINNTDIIQIPLWEYDAAGHIIGKHSQEYTLPYGYKTFKGNSGSTSASNTQDTMGITGDSWVQTTVSENNIAFAHIGPVEGNKTADTESKPQFGNTFTFNTYDFDNKGHRYNTTKHSIKIPNITLTDTQSNGADVITQLTFTNGNNSTLVSTRTNIGNLKMTGYELPTSISAEALSPSESLNNVLGKLEYRLNKEISDRRTAIDDLDYTDMAVGGQYVSSVSQVNGKISVNRTNLPTYTLTPGSTNGTVAFNNVDVGVTGLGSAAYTSSTAYDAAGAASTAEQNAKDYADGLASNYATAEQGANALQLSTQIIYNDTTNTVETLLNMIVDLQAQVSALEAKVNENHPVENTETTE